MKTIIKSTLLIAFMAISCNSKTSSGEQPKGETAELYACPMHPEVTGKKGEKCSKCGMELTEPVEADNAKTDTATTAEGSGQ